jgi:hypothetical protein
VEAGVKRRGEATRGRAELRRTAAAMVLVFAMIALCIGEERRGEGVLGGSGVLEQLQATRTRVGQRKCFVQPITS